MVFGCFDGIHPGHEFFLSKAAQRGDELIVVLARDETIKRVKGKSPKYDEQQRFAALARHPKVDQVTYGTLGPNKLESVFTFSPDIICLGYDQQVFVEKLLGVIKSHELPIQIERLDAFDPDRYKSSLINGDSV